MFVDRSIDPYDWDSFGILLFVHSPERKVQVSSSALPVFVFVVILSLVLPEKTAPLKFLALAREIEPRPAAWQSAL